MSHASARCAITSVADVVPEAAETRVAAGSFRSGSNHAATYLAYSYRYHQLLNVNDPHDCSSVSNSGRRLTLDIQDLVSIW